MDFSEVVSKPAMPLWWAHQPMVGLNQGAIGKHRYPGSADAPAGVVGSLKV
jgi:hypothetical protein